MCMQLLCGLLTVRVSAQIKNNATILVTAMAVNNILSFISETRVLYLQPASVKLKQANVLISKYDKISGPFNCFETEWFW